MTREARKITLDSGCATYVNLDEDESTFDCVALLIKRPDRLGQRRRRRYLKLYVLLVL